jgi:hypothetical protein
MKKVLILVFAFVTIFSFSDYVFASTTAGFIPGQIWYSKDSLEEGDSVKVYTALWNGSENPIFTKVIFYDKEIVLGTREVTVPSMATKDVSISWQVTAGDHNIHAKIISSTISKSGKEESVVLTRSATGEDHQYVSVKLKKADGETATGSDIVNSQITNIIDKVVPESLSKNVSSGLDSIDSFRLEKSKIIEDSKKVTEDKIEILKSKTDNVEKSKKIDLNSLDVLKKPLFYVELFLLKILAFIFSNKWIFYGIIVFLLFLILRFFYYKIRRK